MKLNDVIKLLEEAIERRDGSEPNAYGICLLLEDIFPDENISPDKNFFRYYRACTFRDYLFQYHKKHGIELNARAVLNYIKGLS